MVFSTVIPGEAANDDVKLHSSDRDIVKMTNLTHSTESSILKVVRAYRAQSTISPEILLA